MKSLHRALLARGHDVTRTPTDWIERDASDEMQLLAATAQGRCIFTFNIRDFVVLSRRHPSHRGILLAAQARWTLSELIGVCPFSVEESHRSTRRLKSDSSGLRPVDGLRRPVSWSTKVDHRREAPKGPEFTRPVRPANANSFRTHPTDCGSGSGVDGNGGGGLGRAGALAESMALIRRVL